MEGLLAFLFWVFLIILIVRVAFKYLVPFLLRRKLEKMMGGNSKDNPFGQAFDMFNAAQKGKNNAEETNESAKKESGKTNVEYMPPKNKKKFNFKDAGEYIDFEDVE
ncbi:MAG: DUF4834 family protein [Bacteroidales bacterium]